MLNLSPASRIRGVAPDGSVWYVRPIAGAQAQEVICATPWLLAGPQGRDGVVAAITILIDNHPYSETL